MCCCYYSTSGGWLYIILWMLCADFALAINYVLLITNNTFQVPIQSYFRTFVDAVLRLCVVPYITPRRPFSRFLLFDQVTTFNHLSNRLFPLSTKLVCWFKFEEGKKKSQKFSINSACEHGTLKIFFCVKLL